VPHFLRVSAVHFGRLADRPHRASTSLHQSSFCGVGWPWPTIRKLDGFLKFLNEVAACSHFILAVVDDTKALRFLKFLNEVTVSSHFTSQVAEHLGDPWWRACCHHRLYRGVKSTTPGKEATFGSDRNTPLGIARRLPTSLRSMRRSCRGCPAVGSCLH
jgi:hypothetical protein